MQAVRWSFSGPARRRAGAGRRRREAAEEATRASGVPRRPPSSRRVWRMVRTCSRFHRSRIRDGRSRGDAGAIWHREDRLGAPLARVASSAWGGLPAVACGERSPELPPPRQEADHAGHSKAHHNMARIQCGRGLGPRPSPVLARRSPAAAPPGRRRRRLPHWVGVQAARPAPAGAVHRAIPAAGCSAMTARRPGFSGAPRRAAPTRLASARSAPRPCRGTARRSLAREMAHHEVTEDTKSRRGKTESAQPPELPGVARSLCLLRSFAPSWCM